MDSTAKKLIHKAFFLLLVLFPLGQLIRIPLGSVAGRIVLHPVDLVAGFIACVYVFTHKKEIKQYVLNPHPFLLSLIFSFLASLEIYSFQAYLGGVLYLIRVCAYLLVFRAAQEHLSESKIRVTVLDALVGLGVAVSIVGFAQYLLQPDLRNIVAWGWDGHLYRLVGSFIDPAFTGIILVCSVLVAFYRYERTYSRSYLYSSIGILVALLLTYSRASYLALGIGIVGLVFFVKSRMKKTLIALLLGFVVAIPFLPRPAGVGVKLERTDTIVYRANNYEETFAIWKTNPLFGVGYNMICGYKKEVLGNGDMGVNSCAGADSSLLLILATTGVIGMITFVYSIVLIREYLLENPLLLLTSSAIFVHSLFNNSLFYPWVMLWLALLFGIFREYKKE